MQNPCRVFDRDSQFAEGILEPIFACALPAIKVNYIEAFTKKEGGVQTFHRAALWYFVDIR